MSHARPPPDRRPPPSQRLWAALRPSPQATPGQTDAAYTPTDTKALALKHQGVEPGAAVEAAAAPPAAVAAVSSPAIAAPAAVVPRKDSLFTSPLARNTSLSEPVTPAEIKRVTQLQQFDSLSRKATKEEEAPAHSKIEAPVWIGPKPVGPVAEGGGAGGRLVGFTDGKDVFLRKEGKGGPLLCNLTGSEGLDLAAGGAATVSVRGFSADGKWLLARSGEKALVAFPVGGTTPVEVVAGGKGVTVGGVHCVDTQEDFSGVLVEVTGLVPGGASAVFRASLDPVTPPPLETRARKRILQGRGRWISFVGDAAAARHDGAALAGVARDVARRHPERRRARRRLCRRQAPLAADARAAASEEA